MLIGAKPCIVAAAAALLSACGSTEKGPAASSVGPTEPGNRPGELADGGFMEFFFPSEETSKVTEAIRESALRDCMHQRGFELLSVDQEARLEPFEADRYRAALSGGHQATSASSITEDSEAAAADTGCEEVAGLAVRDREAFRNPLYTSVLEDYHAQLRSDERMIAATQAWADCVESQAGLLAATQAPITLTRGNIGLVREAEAFIREGRNVRWLTLAEADELNTSELPQPVEMKVNATSGVGYVASGPPTVTDQDSAEALARRREELDALEQSCWNDTEGPIRVAELQRAAMERVAQIRAASE